jgi:hypothetical protein
MPRFQQNDPYQSSFVPAEVQGNLYSLSFAFSKSRSPERLFVGTARRENIPWCYREACKIYAKTSHLYTL